MKENPVIPVVFLNIGSDQDLAIAVEDTRGPGGARHHYEVIPQDGEKTLAEIDFQKGPIAETGVNGVQNEQLLGMVIDRLVGFQAGGFPCEENAKALELIMQALNQLQIRTELRKARGVEGTSTA